MGYHLGTSPIEFAIAEKDAEILSMLIACEPRAKANNFNLFKESLIDALEGIPDLSMEMHFHCDSSFIPFVQSFTPSDVYRVLDIYHIIDI